MKKLRLDIDALDVVSFSTDGDPDAPRGTVEGQDSTGIQTNSFFTLGGHASCDGACMTLEYDTCWEAGPTVGPSCDYYCAGQSIGCHPETEAPTCAPPETEYRA